jgi:ATP-binding cassette, subfamily F, member 3
MTLVRFSDVSRSFGPLDVLADVSFQIAEGEKLGLIGANGSGKSTLLGLIEAPEEADKGRVDRHAELRTGRIEQHQNFSAHAVLDEALRAFDHLRAAEDRLREMEARMEHDHDASLLDQYSRLQDEFEAREGYTYRARTESALSGLGFRHEQFRQDPVSLSGGEKNRLALARLLLADVNLLLLDEPTNHLDVSAIEWLERYLRDTEKAVLVVSHDRLFLDRVVGGILELEKGRLRQYRGNYSAYVEQRAARLERQAREWNKQQEWIARTEDYIRRNIAGQKTRQAQSRRRQLEKIDRIERPEDSHAQIQFRFSHSGRAPRRILRSEDLSVGYSRARRILEGVSVEIERGERWALMGANGSGKTTLLATLSGRLPVLAGSLERGDVTAGYYDQELAGLTGGHTILEELRSIEARETDGYLRSFLAGFGFRGEDVHKSISNLSGGEKSRLALACLVYQAPPVLFLDEPTNHLDITSREALESALADYPGTLVFVTHDRRLIERVATHIVYLDGGQVELFHSLDEVEERLSTEPASGIARTSPAPERNRAGVSKNQQAGMQQKIERLESGIAAAEKELSEIEASFGQAGADFDWERANRRHLELTRSVEGLYARLDSCLGKIESD